MRVRRWVRVCSLAELEPGRGVAALVDGREVAIFLLAGSGPPGSRLRAVDNLDPASGAGVLSRGLVGSAGSVDYVASPMHKHRFDLATGENLDPGLPGLRVWPVRLWGQTVEVLSLTDSAGEASGFPAAVATHCPFCALQCAMNLRVPAETSGAGAEVRADPTFPVNEGRMCIKGWASVELLGHPERIPQPLVRDPGGEWQEVPWETALDLVAERVAAIQAAHGRDAVGVFGSGALTNEAAYALGKFTRVALGTANVDYNGRFCMSSAAAAQNRVLGIDRGLPFPVADIARTGGLVLWGANPADTMPPLMHRVEQMRSGGGKLAVVDPRRTATAELADLHVQPVPGTDLAVALGLLRLATVTGAVDDAYVAERTSGWPDLRRSVEEWTPERVRAVSGVVAAELEQLLDVLTVPAASMLLTGRGPEQQSKGVDTVTALIDLMLVLGRVGQPASGYGCLTGQANGQGGREHGQKADQLPGYRSIADPSDRAAVAEVWGVDASSLPGPGLSAVEMLDRAGSEGGIKALLVFGSDLASAGPDANRCADRLADLELLVVADAYWSTTARAASVVLPVAQWAEQDGTVTNLEGRVLRRRRALDPPEGVRTDLEILSGLAQRLGAGRHFPPQPPEAVFAELCRASAGGRSDYSGMSYQRLDAGHGLFWPCPDPGHPGTERLFGERFAHNDGRARLVPVAYRTSAEIPDGDFPLYLTTGRHREHYNTGTQTRRLKRLQGARPAPKLEIHPDAAAALGIDDGVDVLVESRRGSVTLPAALTDAIRPDTVFLPIHWGGRQAANMLTVADLDPLSRMPEFKVCAVRVAPAGDASEDVCRGVPVATLTV